MSLNNKLVSLLDMRRRTLEHLEFRAIKICLYTKNLYKSESSIYKNSIERAESEVHIRDIIYKYRVHSSA